MKTISFTTLLFLILSLQSFGQTTKMFTKTVNYSVITNFSLQPIADGVKIKVRAEFYYDKSNNSGVIKIFDLAHNSQREIKVNQMYTNITKGIIIYYFQSSDGKYKISVSKEENGFAIGNYIEKIVTVYGNV